MHMNGAAVQHHGPTRSDRVLTVGAVVPEVRIPALAATVGRAWESDSAWVRGRWVALLYWPKHTCLESTEDVTELVRLSPAFSERDTQFLVACAAIDLDRRSRAPQRRFTSELPFPVLVDVAGELAGAPGAYPGLRPPPRAATLLAPPPRRVRWATPGAPPPVPP